MKRVAFLRGINVSGRNKVPMKDLQTLCSSLSWGPVTTHLQTGNVVFTAKGSRDGLELELQTAIEERFGLEIPVTIRSSKELTALVSSSPLAEQASLSPSKVLLYFTKNKIEEGALDYLVKRAAASEEVCIGNEALWIYFPSGVGSSKLTPAVIDRAIGCSATGRNWNTVTKIQSLCK